MVKVLDEILANDDAAKDTYFKISLGLQQQCIINLTLLVAEQHHNL